MTGTPQECINFLIDAISTKPGKLWNVTEHRRKRTLSQNAYYWALIGKTARALRISTTELHNRMLRDVADRANIAETFSGKKGFLLLPDTEETEKKALAMETVHIKPTSHTRVLNDGITYRTYVLLKGSSAMDTEEMGALLDHLIEAAQEIGIETMTPRELATIREHERGKDVSKHNDEYRS